MDAHPIELPVKFSLYQTIVNELMEELSFGKFAVGDVFYTEEALIRRFNVAKMTVREALRRLNDAGYIMRRRGVGAFVRAVPDKPCRIKITRHCMLGVLPGKRGFKGSLPLTRLLAALHDCAMAQGYLLSLGHKEVAPLLEAQVDGLIVLGDLDAENIQRLQRAQIPVVAMAGKYKGIFPTLTTDMRQAGQHAWNHLSARGCRRVALIGWGKDAQTVKGRMLPGLLSAAAAGAAAAGKIVNLVGEDALERLARLLADPPRRPDALLLMNGMPVFPVLRLLAEQGIKVPEQMALLVHGEKAMELDTMPPLSVIKHDFEEAAVAAMEMTMRLIRGAPAPDAYYGSFTVERGSCRPRN